MLLQGCDCLGYIKYFDAYFKNFTGGGETIENYVCLHEKDHEMLRNQCGKLACVKNELEKIDW